MTALDLLLADGVRALPILMASLIGSFIIIERLFAVRVLRREASELMVKLRSRGFSRDPAGVQSFLAGCEGRAAAVIGHAVGRSDLASHEIVRLTDAAWADEADRLERPLTLGVIAAIAAFLAGLLPLLLSLLELTRPAADSSAGLLLPSASVIVSAVLGCAVGCLLALGLFIARRDLHKLRAEGRTLVPEFVQLLQEIGRDASGATERPGLQRLSAALPVEDEFFRPKAPAGIG
jgi:hypothetical protein